MQKVFAKKIKDDIFSFFEDDQHHLLKVLKIKLNEKIICVFEQKKYLCKIISLEPLFAQIQIEIEQKTKNNFCIDLFQALIKPKSFELIVSKSVELNVNNFYPVLFARSQNNLTNDNRIKTIIKSSASQSNQDEFLNFSKLINFKDLLSLLTNNNYDLIIIPYENCKSQFLTNDIKWNSVKKVAIVIGPEGGFTNNEINELCCLNNTKIVMLTNTILRSETAAIYTISIVSNFLLFNRKEED